MTSSGGISAAAAAVARAEAEDLELVRFLYADHGGVTRGKSAARRFLAQRIDSGIGHTTAMMAMTMLDTLQPVEGMSAIGEVRIKPDPDTLVVLPYAPGAGAMLADLVRPDGEPWAACSRTFLRTAADELAAAGYAMSAAFEPEFTIGYREPGPHGGPDRLRPADDSLCYSATGFHQAHDFIIELVRALNAQDLQVEHYYPELGHGQHEIPIRYAGPLRAADNHILYRETVRGTAIRRGLWASLAPKPIADQAGNGAHLHVSLTPQAAGATWPAGQPFTDPADRYGLAAAGYHFIGGLLAHLPGLLALTCGSVNSYRRLQPRFWSSAFTIYGMDNREAAVRICSPLRGDPASTPNLELKPSDSSANPYLALGGVIHAGLDGIRRKLHPGEPVNVDPATMSAAEREAAGARRLPQSLTEALDALEADPVLMTALGPLRSAGYLAVKRAEAAAFAERDAAWECFQHFLRF
jgi:glutamine synthetase